MLPLELDVREPWLDAAWISEDILFVDGVLARLKVKDSQYLSTQKEGKMHTHDQVQIWFRG